MKRTVSFAMIALLLAVLLAGCEWPGGWFGGMSGGGSAGETAEEAPVAAVMDITGSWSADLDMSGFLNELLADDEEFGKYMTFDSFNVRLLADFSGDGAYSMRCDPDSVQAAMESQREQITAAAISYLEDMARENGLDLTAEQLMEKAGLTMDSLLTDINKFFGVEKMLGGILDMSGRYLCEDGLLALSNDPAEDPDPDKAMTVTLEGDVLTLTGGDWYLQFEGLYPVVFHRGT